MNSRISAGHDLWAGARWAATQSTASPAAPPSRPGVTAARQSTALTAARQTVAEQRLADRITVWRLYR